MIRAGLLFIFVCCSLTSSTFAQKPDEVTIDQGVVRHIRLGAGILKVDLPLFTLHSGAKLNSSERSDQFSWEIISKDSFAGSFRLKIRIKNSGRDTLQLHNLVPFGETNDRVHITGLGNHRLSRAHLFIPGKHPVNVIVPDNSWEMGWGVVSHQGNQSIYCLARRDAASITKGTRRRFETELFPGGTVDYWMYFEFFSGDWRSGLKQCFQDRKLYDVEHFDDQMYSRQDLKWIQGAYVMHLLMAWDKSYYDAADGKFNLIEFLEHGKKLYGGDDVICLWPTWPSLGLDQRNQFDMYRDLPGGTVALRKLADTLRSHGSKFFIAYNPWDEGTRKEELLKGLEQLIRDTGADGVVLDTRGSSSLELQDAADRVRPGVVMYSEGMAVPRDMPGIVSGRVHNALYYPPMLNLNKLIQPSFSIFRVAEVFKEPIQREYATAFFNGYGTEINQFAPGHPDWEEEQYRYLGKTSMILRENSKVFNSQNFQPLVETFKDSIWVNGFHSDEKSVYTIFSIIPQGFKGKLIEVDKSVSGHWVDLWNHVEVSPGLQNGRWFIPVIVDGFSARWLGTNNEGQNGCVARLPEVLKVKIENGQLFYSSNRSAIIRIWTGAPDYGKKPWVSKESEKSIHIRQTFGSYEGRFVVQAMDENGQLLDERIVEIAPGTPVLISLVQPTEKAISIPKGMVLIPGGKFRIKTTHGDEFIPYPADPKDELMITGFYMDRFPVTNAEFLKFIESTGYGPADSANFLKHWRNGKPLKGEEKFPVVNVSLEDAHAFAAWAGKRLPTEAEWQFAAQTPAENEWPWKQSKPVTREKQYVNETLTTTKLVGVDPKMTNTGDDRLHSVGDFPKGVNPYGLQDLVGSVWQLTNDVYESGSYRYVIMKGGSYFKPSSSWWYVQGGPRELHYRQYLLRISPGFERNSTVGFRCVKDY